MKKINSTVANIKESIFSQMTALANKHNAINLSQGFPNFEGPEFIREALSEAIKIKALGQYAPMPGIPQLNEQLESHFKTHYDLSYSAKTSITVTNGATEAIMVGSLALIEPGDEVILFEPFYDSYPVAAELAGAKIKVVTLHGPDFKWNSQELKEAFSPKTKLVYFNNPHNPTGRVFEKEELEELGKLVKDNDAFILSDEVYEFLTFDGRTHTPTATVEGLKERTLTIGSAGKTFGHTGLKVGWLASSPELSHACRMVHQFNVFSVNPMAQYAVAIGLEKMDTYKKEFQNLYQDKRDLLFKELEGVGLKPCQTEGTYFTLVPIPQVYLEKGHDDQSFCRLLIEKHQTATIPPSAFYRESKEGQHYLRFCFAKTDDLIAQAGSNLKGVL